MILLKAFPPIHDAILFRIERSHGNPQWSNKCLSSVEPGLVEKWRQDRRAECKGRRNRNADGTAERNHVANAIGVAEREITGENAAETLTNDSDRSALGLAQAQERLIEFADDA